MEEIKNIFNNHITPLLNSEDFIIYILFAITILNLLFTRSIIPKLKSKASHTKIDDLKIDHSLKEEIFKLQKQIKDLQKYKDLSSNQIQKMIIALKEVKKIETKKYNPFADAGVGGLQSFSTAMIDLNGNGVVLSSLYSRSSTRVTMKEIENWNPLQELSPEEKEVLEKTKQ